MELKKEEAEPIEKKNWIGTCSQENKCHMF